MAKIGLIDVDSHNFPNLALMKISAYHKNMGDHVQWYNMFDAPFDIVYQAKVFTFTSDYLYVVYADRVIKGGVGYGDYSITVPDENIQPDYSLYPICKWYDGKTAYGFLTRGCIRNCKWCVVPKKEGYISKYMDIDDILQDKDCAILLDNNVISCDYGVEQLKKIMDKKIKVDFNQGLDARIIAKDINTAEILSKIKWIKYLRMACDTKSQIPYVDKALTNLNKYGLKNYKVFVYVLVVDIPDALDRVMFLKERGCIPFAQPYRDFETNKEPDYELKRFARWVNHKAIFKSVAFKDYK